MIASRPHQRKIPSRLLLAASMLAAATSLAGAAEVSARVTVDRAGTGVRLVISHAAPVDYAIEAGAGTLRVLYTAPVEFDPSRTQVGDPVLERYTVEGGRTLVLHTGKEFAHYESFELSNPFRLVIDLQRAPRDARAGREPAPLERRDETIIVLDPGHGGIEHGALGPTGLLEKDVALDLALRLKRELQSRAPRISVVLTRDEDRLLGLDERTAVANHNKADLFVSIHLNASRRGNAEGAETYYLSTDATDDEARLLAGEENRSLVEGAGEFAGRPDLDLVLWDLAQNQYVAESAALADSIQQQMNSLTGTRNRGVRQAPFRVLMGAMMPAVLVEVGFISSPAEEARYYVSDYRDRVVEALANAIEEFLHNLRRIAPPGGPFGPP